MIISLSFWVIVHIIMGWFPCVHVWALQCRLKVCNQNNKLCYLFYGSVKVLFLSFLYLKTLVCNHRNTLRGFVILFMVLWSYFFLFLYSKIIIRHLWGCARIQCICTIAQTFCNFLFVIFIFRIHICPAWMRSLQDIFVLVSF